MKAKTKTEFEAKVGRVLAGFRTLPLAHKDTVMSHFSDTLRSNPALCCTALQRIYDHFYLQAEEERATQFFMDQKTGLGPD
jgi:hypothetical protein